MNRIMRLRHVVRAHSPPPGVEFTSACRPRFEA
jgi:hypothetical protein